MTQLGSQTVLAVSDASYMVLSLEGLKWVLYAAKGNVDNGENIPTGTVLDLKGDAEIRGNLLRRARERGGGESRRRFRIGRAARGEGAARNGLAIGRSLVSSAARITPGGKASQRGIAIFARPA